MMVERNISWVDEDIYRSPKFTLNCLTHGAVRKAFGWKVLQSEILIVNRVGIVYPCGLNKVSVAIKMMSTV